MRRLCLRRECLDNRLPRLEALREDRFEDAEADLARRPRFATLLRRADDRLDREDASDTDR